MSEQLARQLKELRAALGLSQTQAAARLGIPRRTLISWENDQRTPGGLAMEALQAKLKMLAEAKPPVKKKAPQKK
jgi:DNA-binding transcriptional regulator YiaG